MHERSATRTFRITRSRFLLAAMILAATSAALPACAQDASPTRGPWWTLWSQTSDQDRILWAMWTIHLDHLDEGWSNDAMGGAVYRGFFGATFRTTHGPRAYSLGVERVWITGERGPAGGSFGFRTGLVYGYDERLGWMAEKFPVLPSFQLLAYGRVGPLTAELTYTWVVISVTAGVRF